MRSSRIVRTALALAIASAPHAAVAQTTGGIIGTVTDAATGKPISGAIVTAQSPSLQGEASAWADASGAYHLELLPPGVYSVVARAEGYVGSPWDGARVAPDKVIRVNVQLSPSTVTLEEVIVTRTPPPAVNVSSAETGVVVTSALVESVPFQTRRFDAVAAIAPTAHADRHGIGFAGAQSPENRYWIDAFDVTDPHLGTSVVPLVPEFVEQVDVKTGNYAAEYGRATGGLVSAVTKSGSNELHGTIFSSGLWKPRESPVGRNGESIWTRSGAPGSYDVDTGVELGGPIARDRLWFHAGVAPGLALNARERFLRANVLPDAGGACPTGTAVDPADSLQICKDATGMYLQTDLDGTTRRYRDRRTTWRFHGKLTWHPAQDHTATLAVFGAPYAETTHELNLRAAPYLHTQEYAQPVFDVVGRWNGRFASGRLIAESLVGYHRQALRDTSPLLVDGVDLGAVPGMVWRTPQPLGQFEVVPDACGVSPLSCRARAYRTGGWGGLVDTTRDRVAARLSAATHAEALGAHVVKVGLDVERTTASLVTHDIVPVYQFFPNLAVAGLPSGPGFILTDSSGGTARAGATSPADLELFRETRASSWSVSPAVFVQDAWRVIPDLTINAGVRWEWQHMDRGEERLPSSRIDLADNVAPRFQVVWDPSRRGRSKIAASWGRFYEAIPLDVGSHALGGGRSHVTAAVDARACPGFTGPTSGAFDPSTCGLVRGTSITSSEQLVPVAPDLRGQFVDQFAATAEVEPFTDVSIGITYEGRRLGRVIEDLSSDDGATYFVANPGESRPFSVGGVTYDARAMEATDPTTGRRYVARFPRPQRSYDAVTLRLSKAFAREWLAEASYTWSQLRGNYEGLFRSENDQLLPNLTSEYDLPSLMPNRNGLLPADRTHAAKLYGARRVALTSRLAATLGVAGTVFSGAPVSALASHPVYGPTQAFVVPRGMGGRTPVVAQLDARLTVQWALSPTYALRASVDVYNALDARTATAMDEIWTSDVVQPVSGMRCRGDAVKSGDPAAALLASCPELAYLKTIDGRPAVVSPNWGRPREHQVPRATRLSLAFTF